MSSHLCVVGDPDQSIYGWRGADRATSSTSSTTFRSPGRRLERNYRSAQVILDAASAGSVRIATARRSGSDRAKGGDRIVYFRGADELEEADFIMKTALGAVSSDAERTVAILYRTNAQSRVIEDALMRSGSPTASSAASGSTSEGSQDALAYLKLLLNPRRCQPRRVINVPARGSAKA